MGVKRVTERNFSLTADLGRVPVLRRPRLPTSFSGLDLGPLFSPVFLNGFLRFRSLWAEITLDEIDTIGAELFFLIDAVFNAPADPYLILYVRSGVNSRTCRPEIRLVKLRYLNHWSSAVEGVYPRESLLGGDRGEMRTKPFRRTLWTDYRNR